VDRRVLVPTSPALPSKERDLERQDSAIKPHHAAQFGTMITGPNHDGHGKGTPSASATLVEREIETPFATTTGQPAAELIMGSARFVAPKTLEVAPQ